MHDNNARPELLSSQIFQEFLPWAKTFYKFLFFTLFFLICYSLNLFKTSRKRYPPGPIGLPIVGYVPFLEKYAHLQFIELGKKYGDIFSLQLGSRFVVVLNNVDAIKEGYTKPEFQGRPQHNAFAIFKTISPFFKCENDVWTEHRRLFVHTMRDLGMGKSRMEQHIQNEISHFMAVLRSYNGQPADLHNSLSLSMSNIISAFVFNERYDYDSPETKEMNKILDLVFEVLGQTASRIFFPWLKYIPFMMKTTNTDEAIQAGLDMSLTFRKRIKQHEETLDPNNIRDYIDSYLIEMKSRKEKSPNTTLSGEALVGSLGDIFGAGSETTKTTLLWIIYTVATYPDVQRRIQREIMEHIGPERVPEYTDIKIMSYTHAVILEVMRWKTMSPIPILRSATKDATLRGYYIPKGTILMANLWNAHHDAELWTNPDVFMPERFLSEDGQSVQKSPNFMAFSIGKRACPGEVLANMEIFLFLVSILQMYDVSFPRGMKPTFEAELTMVYKPKAYMVHLTPRDLDNSEI